MMHTEVLRNFQLQILRLQSGFPQYPGDELDKVLFPELSDGQVDGNGKWRISGILPSFILRASRI